MKFWLTGFKFYVAIKKNKIQFLVLPELPEQ